MLSVIWLTWFHGFFPSHDWVTEALWQVNRVVRLYVREILQAESWQLWLLEGLHLIGAVQSSFLDEVVGQLLERFWKHWLVQLVPLHDIQCLEYLNDLFLPWLIIKIIYRTESMYQYFCLEQFNRPLNKLKICFLVLWLREPLHWYFLLLLLLSHHHH